ncbi:Re/Si-specific NAD(P)(+) transhydrogenase subunit alpha [Parvibaculum sp.]|uniref:Re/Si-specific NAD(P)(+) transhydrogenase subunit alpha n=1 Tax=Parvibaculum sp. TaxID=2024848 RepID=UPI00272EE9B0|nr:Re/Si-specific NAD(P)(+) transhydrogenase subunit alpha [Parvibaculum sp.]MDP1628472.1 Re/Si-specific NAD(P)(+) transhydrogenase subunit alpha [Parvibaculum sp.]MDP2151804.1 Re/Si-specific NAD(P)(+) transhydrogenase subunit alpha [Parvibaculum sp.]MDP3326927.1 Re/Si-specific NAD(P)(+) transhydrogenase subunit alpha [Parvibaculum sp.]
MKLAIPKERLDGETRVAASPETVKKLTALGLEIIVESGAGEHASIADDVYREAGAAIASSEAEALKDADIVFKVRAPSDEEIGMMKRGTMLAAILSPWDDKPRLKKYADAGINAFAMEFMPRITRAQSMDVLSSQSNLAGYKAVINAAAAFTRAMPMMMTAAGTIAPARVFIMGVGVAGLQAIATAKRLGAIVSATDVRSATKEQVQSLGGTFIMVESEESGDAAGGYAKEMSDEYKRAQAALVAEHIKKQDIVITTALIPGRPAPELVSEEMVKTMKPGSILVDLAVERGGNCPLSEAGKRVVKHGITIIGDTNVAGQLTVDSSALYAKNLLNFITPLIDKETKALAINWEDEIITGTCLTRDGQVVHPSLREGGN